MVAVAGWWRVAVCGCRCHQCCLPPLPTPPVVMSDSAVADRIPIGSRPSPLSQNHKSERCANPVVDHDERLETQDGLCAFRGGDGFAFVLQDSGNTSFEPVCSFDCVQSCMQNEEQSCTRSCQAACPAHVEEATGKCLATCLTNAPPQLMPHAATLSDPLQLAALEAAAAAATATCPGDMQACAAECGTSELGSGAAFSAEGCLSASSRAYCEVPAAGIRPATQTPEPDHGTGPWNRTMEPDHGTGPWNRTLGPDLGTGPWNRTMEPDHGTGPWDRTLGPDLGTGPWDRTLGPDHGTGPWNRTMEPDLGTGPWDRTMEPDLGIRPQIRPRY
jgi:hypothetical protein